MATSKKTTIHPDICAAHEVLRQEIRGLEALDTALDASFVAAVELIAGCSGTSDCEWYGQERACGA